MMPLALGLALLLGQAVPPLVYRFDEVRQTVKHWSGEDERQAVRATRGAFAVPGESVRTGWFGQAILSVPDRGAHFQVYPNARVRLAQGEPGVLLVLERGRIKAWFEHLVDGGRSERCIAVPGAQLVVRGTRYGVEVGADDEATLVVFDGVVEVRGNEVGQAPVRVAAGAWARIERQGQTQLQGGSLGGFSEQSWDHGHHPDRNGRGLETQPAGGQASGALGPLAPERPSSHGFWTGYSSGKGSSASSGSSLGQGSGRP